jgi:malate dehydrogenase (oxaloacetate-decarboxylating)
MPSDPIAYHKKNKGKIQIKPKTPLRNKEDLALAYTPGVAQVSQMIAKDKRSAWDLTNRANSVAIVCDGTAVLGLGDVGPEAAMPVMEGKSAIFKKMAGIDAYPLCINVTETEEIINFCLALEPSFGGINLEDIAAPKCFDILERLEKELTIPVFHDDQDGTAIVTLAALMNALKLRSIDISQVKVVVSGAGAAGISITKLLIEHGVRDVLLVDSRGCIHSQRKDLTPIKKKMAGMTNMARVEGCLEEAVKDKDVFIGVSKGGILTKKMVESMNPDPIVFAMANPEPEISPQDAHEAGAFIVGTGRSDYPNQINNALVFPGIFRGLLDACSGRGDCPMPTAPLKIKAARAIADLVTPRKNKILPDVMNKKVVKAIKNAIQS